LPIGLDKLKICFITDGGRALGLGHVQQSVTFAQSLAHDASICFLTKSDETVVAKIVESGFEVTPHKSDEEIFQHLKAMAPQIIIFDKLDVSEELARDISQTLSARLVIFTNLTAANRYADIAVTADIGSCFENVRYLDGETNTLYFYGPRYWVLRPEFYEYHRLGKGRVIIPERILLMFGGSDPANLTSATLEQLLLLDRVFQIDIVLGAHYCNDEDLSKALSQVAEQGRVTVYRDIRNVAELMYGADLVIASPGLSAFEALRVGTPVIVVPHDALQRDTYRGFMRMLERDDLCKLGGMIEEADYTYPDDEKIARMEIGEGVEELKDTIMRHPTRLEQ
jgi:spore coat polysaccharide biosynthesis predicted glycosyltransferase SpsG